MTLSVYQVRHYGLMTLFWELNINVKFIEIWKILMVWSTWN